MKKGLRSFILLVATLITAASATAGGMEIVVQENKVVIIDLPVRWEPSSSLSLTTRVFKDDRVGESSLLQLNFPPNLCAKGVPVELNALKHALSTSATNALQQSQEQSIPILETHQEDVQGYYFSVTAREDNDESSQVGYTYMSKGALSVQGIPVFFTLFSSKKPKENVDQLIHALENARVEPKRN